MLTKQDLGHQNKFWKNFLLLVGLMFMLSSLLFNNISEIAGGLVRIITSRSLLLTDYMEEGNVGSALFNAGLCTIMATLLVKHSNSNFSGIVIAGVLNLTAFSFMGKNPYNIIAPMFGVYVNSKFMKEHFRQYIAFALFATGIGPLISYMTFKSGIPILYGALLGNFLGFIIGFFLPAVSVNARDIHKGFSLYNNGFALGIIYIIMHSVFKMFGLAVEPIHVIYLQFNIKLIILFVSFFASLMLPKIFLYRNNFRNFLNLLNETGKSPCDFIGKYDNFAILFNMGLVGLMGMAYLSIIKANINGINLGGVLAICAFSVYGVNPKNVYPIFIGVFLAGLVGQYTINSESVVIAALFGTTLAPIAGYYGPAAGIIAGFLHLSLVSKTGLLHDGFHLYNNGFASGLIAALLYPVFESIKLKKNNHNTKRDLL